MTNYQAVHRQVKYNDHGATHPEPPQRTPTQGARAFCSILRVYACAVGPRAGWSKFSDNDRREIINRHLVDDGRSPIARATYYRWKGEARDAGLLDFKSAAKRPGDRNQAAGGRWMKVATVPTSTQCTGRRPRLLHETFATPPPHETFATAYKEEDLRDLSSQRDQKKEKSLVSSPKPKKPASERATTSPRFSEKHTETERLLTNHAEQASEAIGQPWEPLQEKLPWRLATIERALGTDHTDEAVEELVLVVVGMSIKRASDIERTTKYGRWHPFWEIAQGDVIARALTIDSAEWRASLRESGARFLENMHRQEDVRREAGVGSRDYNTRIARHDASLVPFDDDEVEKALWVDGELVINLDWLQVKLEEFYQHTARMYPDAAAVKLSQGGYERALKRLGHSLVMNPEQRAIPSSTAAKKNAFATRVLQHFQYAVVDERFPRFPSYAQRVDQNLARLLTRAPEGRARARARAHARAMERDEVQREAIGARPEPPAEPLPPTTVKEPMPDHLESDLLREFWAKHPEDDKHVHIPDDFFD